MVPFFCKYPNVQKVILCIIALALTVSELLAFEMFDLQKVGQDRGV